MKRFSDLVALALWLASANTIEAQSSRYVSLALGSARLESPGPQFALGWVHYPVLALGYTSTRGHGIELRVSRLDAETTADQGGEAPYTRGLHAIPFELAYHYQFSHPGRRMRSRLGVGVLATSARDRWRSDTPTERASSFVYGGSASMALTTRLVGATAAVARGAYHRVADSDDRPPAYIGLNGYRLEVGLEVVF